MLFEKRYYLKRPEACCSVKRARISPVKYKLGVSDAIPRAAETTGYHIVNIQITF